MSDNSEARTSTNQETARLVRDPDVEVHGNGHQRSSFGDSVTPVVQEPLKPLTKILLILSLVLLFLSSVFIGLFAGVQHKLNLEQGRYREGNGGKERLPAETLTVTATSTTTIVYITTAPIPVPTSPPEEKSCLSSECIVLSASILSSLDTLQDPCENFYDFTNGRWLNAHPLPADRSSFGKVEAPVQQNKQRIQKILESSPSSSSSYDGQLHRKLQDLYSSCLDERELDDIGAEPLINLVQTLGRLFKGENNEISPISKDEKVNGLTAAITFLHSRGIGALFHFIIEGDGLSPNFMSPWFYQPDLGLPSKEYYEEESITEIYQSVLERLILALAKEDENLMRKSIPTLAMNDDSSNVWPPWPSPFRGEGNDEEEQVNKMKESHILAKKVLHFESRLAAASLDPDLFQDRMGTYNPLPISNLTKTLPQINFSNYFSTLAPRAFPDQVIITYPAYVASLSKILDDTSSDVIEAYLVLRAALSLSPYLGMGTEAWQAQRTLQEALGGIKKGAIGDRGEYCAGRVEFALGFAAGRYFVNETFGGKSREKATKVITDIVKAFQSSLSHIEWMDKQSADAAFQKADAIRVKVGFPSSPNTQDAASIARYYSNVKIRDNTFFENMLSASVSDVIRTWAQLSKQRNPESWQMYPSKVNAYFNSHANEIVFPAGILQPPFFSQNWPSYLSYGGFGSVAAHELTHAFDSAGRLYDQEGKLREWWTNSTSKGFLAKQDCIVKQFSSYTIDDGKGGKIHVNGNLSSGENIGDTGLIQAYRAWKAQYNASYEAGNEYLLPGLNFTREQLFFISYGRLWGHRMRAAAAAVELVRTDPHSPNPYRVDGTLFNIPEFAQAFNCSKNARLNPPRKERCIFW